jgi:septal ring factor EnvC (AmiA/AmiB activator)
MSVEEFISKHKPVKNANNDIIYDASKSHHTEESEPMETYDDISATHDDFNEDGPSYEDDSAQDKAAYKRMQTNPEEDKVLDEFHRDSEKIMAIKQKQEQEREKARESEREDERKILKKKKKEEREARRKRKAEKKAKKVSLWVELS